MERKLYLVSMKYIIWLLILIPVWSQAQSDSCRVQISLLTASPGEELYSTFGHSALRVVDSVNQLDIVYNYGTFNFEEPGFYTKFVRGKLNYFLSRDYFTSFKEAYQQENRLLTEQVLDFSCKQKEEIIRLLDNNLLPQNLYYKYDFTFDNCTTRLLDLVEKAGGDSLKLGKVLHSKKTFRNLIHEYLDYNNKQWSKLGIDLLLGSRLDKPMEDRQVMFLPDYLMYSFDSSKIDGRPLVLNKEKLFQVTPEEIDKNTLKHPFFIFTCLFVFLSYLTFSKNTPLRKILFSLDGLFFFLTGVLGLLLIFMWVGTDHYMCKDNYNLLWSWPLNVVMAFYTHTEKKWARLYFLIYGLFLLLVLGLWFFLPQQLNIGLLPLVAILALRSLSIFRRKKHLYG